MTQQGHPNDRSPAGDELLTISEVAAIVRAPLATLRYSRHLGAGPRSFRLGRRVVYRLGDPTAHAFQCLPSVSTFLPPRQATSRW